MQFHILSFEGPDPYARVGGLATRADGLVRTLAGLGHETHLWFVGAPDLPGYENEGALHLHRWAQWVSRHHPGGVYDGEWDKHQEYARTLPPCLVDRFLLPAAQRGEHSVIMAEEWQTVPAVIHLTSLLERAGIRDRVTVLWNANNTFGFEGIDWQGLERSAVITTVSRYMKHQMAPLGVEALVVPNGLSDEAFQPLRLRMRRPRGLRRTHVPRPPDLARRARRRATRRRGGAAMTGEPWITEPGVYELTDVEYHADAVVGGSLSSTGARTLIRSTPAHFAWQRDHRGQPRAEFDFGKAAHARVLGAGGDVVVITGTGKDPNTWRTDADKAAVKAARAAGQTPIRPVDEQAIDAMATALLENPNVGPLFARPGRRESVWVWQDEETGVWCRVMADFIPDVADGQRRVVVDFKTTADASPAGFAASMAKYGYDQQADWYCTGVQAVDPRTWPPMFVLVAQEKTPPYLVTVGYLSELALDRGRARNRRALQVYRDCQRSGLWPGYPADPIELDLPAWAAREFEYEQTGAPA